MKKLNFLLAFVLCISCSILFVACGKPKDKKIIDFSVELKSNTYTIVDNTITEQWGANLQLTAEDFRVIATLEDNTTKILTSSEYEFVSTLPTNLEDNKTPIGTYTITFSYKGCNDYVLTVEVTKANLTINDIEWNANSFVYDGTEKEVQITNLPSGVTATYTNNKATNVGMFTATATFVCEDEHYNAVPPTATFNWEITKANVDTASIKLTDTSFVYNGNIPNLTVDETTLPNYLQVVSITPDNNTNAGNHTATIKLTCKDEYKKNYNEVDEITLNYKIAKANYDMTSVEWHLENESNIYDGKVKTVSLINLPTGVTATYSKNSATNAGNYTASASFEYDTTNYNTPTIANYNWEIAKAEFTNVSLENSNIEYDSYAHSIAVSGTLPEDTTVNYTYNNVETNSVRSLGQYAVTATLTNSNYNPKTLNATLKITLQGTGTKTYASGENEITIDEGVAEQTVTPIWRASAEAPAFTNMFTSYSESSLGWASLAPFNRFGCPNFVASTTENPKYYFVAYQYDITGTYTLTASSMLLSYSSPDGSKTLTGSGWTYAIVKPTTKTMPIMSQGTDSSMQIKSVYGIDITEGYTPSIANYIDLYGEKQLLPGQDYAGTNFDKDENGNIIVSLTVTHLDKTSSSYTHTMGTEDTEQIVVKSGDIITSFGGVAIFRVNIEENDTTGYSNLNWAVVGDSLTDTSINASKKYQLILNEETNINAYTLGVGGTGYWRSVESGKAFYQRMGAISYNTDIVTIFGSVNDWQYINSSLPLANNCTLTSDGYIETITDAGNDTLDDATLCGYINAAIDVAKAKAPYAKIVLVSGLYYSGVNSKAYSNVRKCWEAVATARGVAFYDIYTSSAGTDLDFAKIESDTAFAEKYTTDYSSTASAYGHPSNAYHLEFIAPEFTKILKDYVSERINNN